MRDSIVFYRSFADAIRDLDAETFKAATLAILDYALDGNEEGVTGIAKTVLTLVKPQIDANNKRYDNGKKGGRPVSEPTENQTETKEEPNHNQTITKAKPNHNQTETKPEPNVYVNENDKEKDSATQSRKREPKHQYGDYKHVLLTDKELETLNAEYGIDRTANAIRWFDAYIEEKGYKCKSHYLAMRRWVFNAVDEKKKPRAGPKGPQWNIEKHEYDMGDLESRLIGG